MSKRKLTTLAVAVALALLGYNQLDTAAPGHNLTAPVTAPTANAQALLDAFNRQISDLQISGEGTVVRVLSDDNNGSRHQRFLLETALAQTILVAHNIDLAPRIDNLSRGDTVAFFGEYEYNNKGGVIHWTHHDPANRHPHGWLKHKGRTYQ
jgi:molybdopterin converting factor small subunit